MSDIPDGWVATEYARPGVGYVVLNITGKHWVARNSKDKVVYANGVWRHPTPAAAIRAIEEMKYAK